MAAMMMPSPRRRARACRLLLAAALAVAALLAFLASWGPNLYLASPSSLLVTVPPRRHPLTLLRAVRQEDGAESADGEKRLVDAVLLPDWEVLLLLHPGVAAGSNNVTATCAFPGGSSSPARALGTTAASGRHAYTCVLPRAERRQKPLRAPRLVVGQHGAASSSSFSAGPLLRWSGRLVYEAAAVDGDVLVFAKGVNPRQGVNRDAGEVRCVYYYPEEEQQVAVVVASLPAITSAQQVFRCPRPEPAGGGDGRLLRVTLDVAGEVIPSMATYDESKKEAETTRKQSRVCACTMVRDVAKFVREWVVYHAAVGVERFFLYDNGSEDDLGGEAWALSGLGVSRLAWPWPKTQEAGLSHAAAAHAGSCEWMAFIDVDEFVFDPGWARRARPDAASMLGAVVGGAAADVGQLTLGCRDFGPSGRTRHPAEGVTQGYTCRRRAEERHKSVVRLRAVAPSLVNSVHHFELGAAWRWERSAAARVNHYKYQAWDEFKVKFRRRVSTYVADWTDPVNGGSRDRTPGLGFRPVQPAGWAHKFCDVHDTLLRDTTRAWFGPAFSFRGGGGGGKSKSATNKTAS